MATAEKATQTLTREFSSDAELLDSIIEKGVAITPIGGDDQVKLSRSIVYKYFAKPTKSGKLPPNELVTQFIMTCKAQRLNPWVKDAWLVGYDGKHGPEFSLITSYQSLAKRAELNGSYEGIEYGVIVDDGEDVRNRNGAFHRSTEKVVGAWAKVYRNDRERPFHVTVNLGMYDKGNQFWSGDKKSHMICKCARAAALREAFPLDLGNMYVEEEVHLEAQRALDSAISETNRRARTRTTSHEDILGDDNSPEASDPPEDTPSDNWPDVYKALQDELATASRPVAVKSIEDKFSELASSDEERFEVQAACKSRVDEIAGQEANA